MTFEKAERKLGEARTRLTYARPYYSDGVYALKMIVTTDVPSLAVDEWWRLYAHPGWVESHDVGQVATGLAHELQHLFLDHAGRAKAVGVTFATMDVWNGEAADPDINDGLIVDCQSCKPVLPPLPEAWCVLPKHLGLPDNRTAEWYFAKRMSDRRESRSGAGEARENGGAGSGGRGRAGAGTGRGGVGRVDFGCGSGSTGVPAPWEIGSPEESGVSGLDAADVWDVRRRTAEAIKSHSFQRGRGSVPSGLTEWAEELLRPERIPWDRALTGAMRRSTQMTAGAVRHSYSRTSRRQHAFNPVIMPAYRRPVPNIALVTDTSMSMEGNIGLVRGVVDSACKHLAVPLRLIEVDAAVHRDVAITSGRLAARFGGGGTDMRVGIELALRRPRPAEIVVVCTDCATPWPARRPSAQIVVAAVGASKNDIAAIPSWATVIEVEPTKEKNA